VVALVNCKYINHIANHIMAYDIYKQIKYITSLIKSEQVTGPISWGSLRFERIDLNFDLDTEYVGLYAAESGLVAGARRP